MKTTNFLNCLFACLALTFNMFATPIVTSLSSNTGASTGGESITITGSGFTGVTAVNFGPTPASSFTFISDTSITVTSPAHAPQTLSLLVTTPSGTSSSSENSYFVFQGDWQAYVTNYSDNTVSILDISTLTNTATLDVGATPTTLVTTPDGTQTYVTNYDNFFGTTVSAIDTQNNTVTNTITVGPGPNALAVTPDGKQIYVADYGGNTISVIDAVNNMVTTTITVATTLTPAQPIAVVISPDGTKAYTANFYKNNLADAGSTLSVIDTTSNTIVNTAIIGNLPLAMVVTPDSTQVYVTNSLDNTVSILDTTTNTITTVTVGNYPTALAITSDGTQVYVVNYGDDTVSVIDVATQTLSSEISVGSNPFLIIITGTQAYVVNYEDGLSNGNISVIDTATTAVTTTIDVGVAPDAITVSPQGNNIYIVNYGDGFSSGNLSVIETVSNTVTDTLTLGVAPTAIGITPDQAPLATFSQSSAPTGFNSVFDASASASPTGSITTYFWDFGDGHTLSTGSPISTHIYTTPGIYNVTLTVTNSAGTSTSQMINFFSFNNNAFATLSLPFTNNGGPTATTTHSITISSGCAICPASKNSSREITAWFVNNANPEVGNGSYESPYQNLSDALSASSPCDVIYVFNGTSLCSVLQPWFTWNPTCESCR